MLRQFLKVFVWKSEICLQKVLRRKICKIRFHIVILQCEKARADVNRDGVVEIVDYNIVHNVMLNGFNL